MEPASHHQDPSRRRAASAERSSAPIDAIHDAGTPVPTMILTRRGVQKVRILSESQLQSLLSSAHDAPPALDLALAGDVDDETEVSSSDPVDGPELMRALHAASLDAIEERMERLSVAFRAIAGALDRLDDLHAQGRPRARETRGPTLRIDLLREMLF